MGASLNDLMSLDVNAQRDRYDETLLDERCLLDCPPNGERLGLSPSSTSRSNPAFYVLIQLCFYRCCSRRIPEAFLVAFTMQSFVRLNAVRSQGQDNILLYLS